MNKWLIAGLIILGIVAAGATYFIASCPCDRIPGVALWGEEQSEPVTDWAFANSAPLCQIQVSDGILPQSLNLNCMADEGELFLSCARCDGKRWSTIALSHPEGKIRIAGKVYPVEFQRVTDPGQLDRAWMARRNKLLEFGRDTGVERAGHWWSFKLTSR